MAKACQPPRVKLICGMISSQPALMEQAGRALGETHGEVELTSEVMDFDFTHYYDRQMSSPLYRQFVAFGELVCPDVLADAKLGANALEREFASGAAGRGSLQGGPARPINIDPGYVESSKLVLASMKNFSHRIYIGRGVYAEVTLLYRRGRWEPLEWTFPDYASGRYWPFLDQVRRRLRRQLAQESPS
ncbi:MAG TPA: DUF4416 family protein [Phycisphaerae bacterium]|nr:DUF4416 family protein [Phycisphaerae bacterium]